MSTSTATKKTSELLASLPRSIWVQRFLLAIQAIVIPLAYYFRPLCVAIAFGWLVYRASQVLHKPLDELAFLLGFDIPAKPNISLAGIRADGAIIHWTLAEKPRSKKELKYAVYLNGAQIGNVAAYESAVTILGLQPDAYYIVRVALVNSNEFGSKSAPIYFRTKPAASGDFFVALQDGHDTDADAALESLPRVRAYRGLKDIAPASPVGAPVVREASTGLAPRKASGRRLSPATLGLADKHDPQPDDSEAPEGAETIQQLTEKLDLIRRETEEAERQAKEEEEEELRLKEELIKERDALRAEVNKQETQSRTLKKQINAMERQNTTAHNERSKHERLLQQKIQERQKLKDDVARWVRETETMEAEAQRLREEKQKVLEEAEEQKEALRARLAEETAKVKAVEDEVKEKTTEIRRLERALKNHSPDEAGTELTLVEQMQNDAEEERAWQAHRANLQREYALAYSKVENARRFHEEQMRYLEALRLERQRQEEAAQYIAPPVERLPRRGDSQRSRHAPPHRHSNADSPRAGVFQPVVTQSPFPPNISPAASGIAGPYINIFNGMTINQPTEEVAMSAVDRDKLTGGALMSPSAGAELLPADLFSGDDNKRESVQPLPGLGSLPGLPGMPGPSTVQPSTDHPGPGPASPASASSRSPSVFASPHASQHNLIGSPEGLMDADRRSIRSTRSNRAPSGGTSSRFSGMFGIKQRSKNLVNEGPPLSKANSMPRQDQGLVGLDSVSRKRTSSISGTIFQSPIDGFDGGDVSPAAAPGRRAFGLFSKDKSGGWPSSFTSFGRRPASPRPGSTHSNELPRPSMDSSRWVVDGWPSGDAGTCARNSPLAFGPGWNIPNSSQTRLYGSRHPSRRPSVQYPASGPPEDIMEDEDSDALDANEKPQLPPIGTKPTPSKKNTENAAKLNPHAKDFKSFFSNMKIGSKDKSTPKEGDAGPSSTNGTPSSTGLEDDDQSPPNSRKSRDTRSMTTTESSLLDSNRTSADLARTPSYSNNSFEASPSLGKESFMQKFTRKSSSGKFALPTFKREKSRLDATSAPREIPMEGGEDDGEGELSASVSSLGGKGSSMGDRSTRSWSSVLKLGKGKKAEEKEDEESVGDE